jgi:hypothetical protein
MRHAVLVLAAVLVPACAPPLAADAHAYAACVPEGGAVRAPCADPGYFCMLSVPSRDDSGRLCTQSCGADGDCPQVAYATGTAVCVARVCRVRCGGGGAPCPAGTRCDDRGLCAP